MRERFRTLRKNPVFDLVFTLVVAVGVAYLVQLWIVKPYRIPSGSMEQTFHLGDRILAARFLYHFTDPQRGDIVVFHPNGYGDTPMLTSHVASVVFVKRVIGMPGDWVRSRGGHVQICTGPAGEGCRQLSEPYAIGRTGKCQDATADFGPELIPPGQYLMLGDNREESDDSRCWGTIRRSQIIGRAFAIYWPLDRLDVF